jgi:SAM-dependent methyltransferase
MSRLRRPTPDESGTGKGHMAKTFRKKVTGGIRRVASVVLPSPVYRLFHGMVVHDEPPPVGTVRFGDFRRLEPMSREYGFDRGVPIDRYYIEKYLSSKGPKITGRVLEIGERLYTKAYGQGVTQSDMLHVNEGIPDTTYVDDLSDGSTLPSNAFDCVILTQTLHLIFDMKKALQTIYRILKPGGVLLVTVPGITQVSDTDWNDTWYWALTSNAARKLHGEVFPPNGVEVTAYGNVLASISFLQGLAASEITPKELDFYDPEYQVTIGIMARKADASSREPMEDRWNYAGKDQFAYDEDTSYQKGIAFLDGQGKIEDWGCGTAYAKRFVTKSQYLGVDGSASDYADLKADLQTYKSDTDCIFMRHVLEHNWGWRAVAANAASSFRKRMVLIVFTPFGDSDQCMATNDGIPDLQLDREELLSYFKGCAIREESLSSKTEYGQETIFYIDKEPSAGAA